ncbi:MAG: pyrroline-5-carboxylate reductase [Alphaproteobacteria bacterium CG1_02_46_17]|nr:MAG: pyrroline-5-carboxylate reductase [Alphaproteobacteria bacterium CG1_02_46_17]
MIQPSALHSRLLLVGCGKMGGALLKGWKEQHPNLSITVVDPAAPDADFRRASDISESFDCIILAVKPQVMTETIMQLKHLVSPATLILSIAAGKPISFFEGLLDVRQPVIRVMPNTPAAIGYGMSVLCANCHVTSMQKDQATLLMSSVGLAEWIDDENLMDAVTAVSGSGPAYVFHLIESLAEAGETVGLSHDLSMKLARQTVVGSALLAQQSDRLDAATLRQNVTSPGGTTEAALKVLMAEQSGLTDLMSRAVSAARNRGRELADK